MASVCVCPSCRDPPLPCELESGKGTRYKAVCVRIGPRCTAVTHWLYVRWWERWSGGWRLRRIMCPLPLSAPEETEDSKWGLSFYDSMQTTGSAEITGMNSMKNQYHIMLELTFHAPGDTLDNKSSLSYNIQRRLQGRSLINSVNSKKKQSCKVWTNLTLPWRTSA